MQSDGARQRYRNSLQCVSSILRSESVCWNTCHVHLSTYGFIDMTRRMYVCMHVNSLLVVDSYILSMYLCIPTWGTGGCIINIVWHPLCKNCN